MLPQRVTSLAYPAPLGPLGVLLAATPEARLAPLAEQAFGLMVSEPHLQTLTHALRTAVETDSAGTRNLLNYTFSLPRAQRVLEDRLLPGPMSPAPAIFQPRPYQIELLEGLRADLREGSHPLLGLVSPMQTGKSFSIGKIVDLLDRMFGEKEILILSSSRVITSQLIGDLSLHLPEDRIGRYDGIQKEVRRVTVASVFSLVRHLEEFDRHRFPFVINDEAYFSKAPTWKKVIDHFIFDQLIALSGTGQGLEDYHISARLDFLRAIEEGWIRDMEGERVVMTGEFTHQHSALERMVWWKPTIESARRLVQEYREKIHGRYAKNLVYAPAIQHAGLLLDAFREALGEGSATVVHSDLSENEASNRLAAWNRGEIEALISIRKLAFGFRGNNAGAVFHTYQTTSPELFAQRTGRAWGVSTGREPPLFVLEAAWDPRSPFMNLARLFGIRDYPKAGFKTRNLRKRLTRQKTVEVLEREISQSLPPEIQGLFEEVPSLPEWRGFMREVQEKVGGDVSLLSQETGIARERLEGYLWGYLPIKREEVEALQSRHEGATRAWVQGWLTVVEEVLEGLRGLNRGEEELKRWAREGRGSSVYDRAASLGEVLKTLFPEKRSNARTDDLKVLAAFREAIEGSKDEIAEGKAFPNTIADRAHRIYCADLPEGKRPPSRETFRFWVSGSNTRPDIMRILNDAGVRTRGRTIDDIEVLAAFRESIEGSKDEIAEGRAFPRTIAYRAHRIYCAGLTEGKKLLSQETFRHWVSGSRARPDVVRLLKEAGVGKQEQAKRTDDSKVLAAFQEAIEGSKDEIAEGRAFPTTIAGRAYRIYCAGLPEGERPPSWETFRSWVSGVNTWPDVVRLLKEAGVGKQKQVKRTDDSKVLAAFQEAIEGSKNEIAKGRAFQRTIADRAYRIYCADLPQGQKPPSREAFRFWVLNPKARPDVGRLLKEAGVGKMGKSR